MSERDERLRKLEPKLSKQKADLLWLAAAADPSLRRHVDAYIGFESYRQLGSTFRENQILLPPPTREAIAGSVDVGEVWYDGPRGRLALQPRELSKHTGIIGSSGSGKTSLALHLVKSVIEQTDVPVFVFDIKRTWRSLAAFLPQEQVRIYTLARPDISPFRMNFLSPPAGIDPLLFDKIATTIADEVLYGGLGSHSIAQIVTAQLRSRFPNFTMFDVHNELQRMASGFGARKRAGDWFSTAMRITSELASPPLGYVINWRENTMEAELEKARLTIFEMEFFTQPQYQYFVTSFLVREYLKRLGTESRDQLQMLVVFEEAGRIFNAPFPQPQFNQVLRECREIGLGILWINQSAEEVGNTAWANTNTLFVFKQISAKDINTVGSAVAFERPKEKSYCARLGVGEAIVRLPDRWRFPFLIRTEDFKKVPISDEEIAAMVPEHLRAIPVQEAKPNPISASRGIKRDETDIKEIITHGGVTEESGVSVDVVGEVRQVDLVSKLAGLPGLPTAQGLPELADSQGRLGAPSSLGGLSGQSARGAQGHLGEQGGPSRPEIRAAAQPANQFASKAEEYQACMAHLLSKVAGEPGKPVTYVYAELGLSKGKGTRVKKAILDAGLASEERTSATGRTEVRLKPTTKGRQWLSDHASLLERPIAKWETKRFGGEKSRKLERIFDEYARDKLHALQIVAEADDLSRGKHDRLVILPDGSEVAAEMITGETKAGELRHALAAINARRKYIGICWGETIRRRIQHYFKEAAIEEGERVRLVTREELGTGAQSVM
jgi:DNA-binding MarR family transcriptional regulator